MLLGNQSLILGNKIYKTLCNQCG